MNRETTRHNPSVSAYRPDIDGLRAIAIGAVLLFHAFPNHFPGGFIGVDVFFVISGFLITSNIYRSFASATFSLGSFYLRRIRRIFPALILMLSSSLAIGWVVLTPKELMQLGRDTLAATGFASNLVYWAESGYFDAAAITKPLLHLWSLGIEEQFYLVWPLLMWFGHRILKGRELAVVIVAISFVACLITTAPLSAAAFFSPATRMWELAVGGVIALSGKKNEQLLPGADADQPQNDRSWQMEVSSCLGLILILSAVWVLDGTPYPGWRALLPTVGAGLIIVGGKSVFVNRYLLSNPLMVFIGLISYPLYLWHWPLLSFAHIARLGVVPVPMALSLLAASVVLAIGTYLLVERPLHRTSLDWASGKLLLMGMVTMGFCGGAIYYSRGNGWSLSQSAVNVAKTHHGMPLAMPVGITEPPAKLLEPKAASEEPETPVGAPSAAPIALVPPSHQNVSNGSSGEKRAQKALLELYREHVLTASSVLGDPDAYLVEMISSRLKATRTGLCEYSNPSTPWPDPTKDRSICEKPIDGAKNVLILGDSIASDAYSWLHFAYPEVNFIQRTGPGCHLQRFEKDLPTPCVSTLRDAKEMAVSPQAKIDVVVLTSLWSVRTPAQMNETPAGTLIDTLLTNGKTIVLIGPPIGFTAPARDFVTKCLSISKDGLTDAELEQCAREHSNLHRGFNKALKEYANQKQIVFVDLHEMACNDSMCPILDDAGQLMYTDNWHRSFPGSVFVASRVRNSRILERLFSNR